MGAKVKRKRFGNFQSSTSVVRYMRTRIDLSQTEVCKCSGWNFRPNDISKVERGIFNIQVGKLKKIAEFFDISIDTILKNDFRAILPVLPADRPERHEKAKSRREIIQKKMDEAGELGEKIVLEMEKERLKPLGLDMFVTADYADDESAGFDIYSFTENAVPMHIEVKSSSGSDRQCFISARYTRSAPVKSFSILLIRHHLDGEIDGLQQSLCIDAGEDEAGLVQRLRALRRRADAHSGDRMADGSKKAALQRLPASMWKIGICSRFAPMTDRQELVSPKTSTASGRSSTIAL